MNEQSFAIVDSDYRRRAELSYLLARYSKRVQPYASPAEISAYGAKADVLLVHDEPGAIAGLIDYMGYADFWCPILSYGAAPSIRRIVHSINSGANDYLTWPLTLPQIKRAIEQLSGADQCLGRQRARQRFAASRISVLTPREAQIIILVTNGLSSRLIADRLNISPRTVDVHRSNALKKLNAEHTVDAVRLVMESGYHLHDPGQTRYGLSESLKGDLSV